MRNEVNALDRQPPSDVKAERAILGAILLENNLCYQAIELLGQGAPFYLPKHMTIFSKMITLTEKGDPIDAVTLGRELRQAKELERVGGMGYISELVSDAIRTDTLEHYTKIVNSTYRLRCLIAAARDIEASCYGEDEPDLIVDRAEQRIFELNEEQRVNDAEDIAVIAARLADHFEAKCLDHSKLIGLSTGYKELDERTSGLQVGVSVIAGRPGHSKTACAVNISCNVVADGGVVYYCSPESSKDQIGQRVLASEARIDSLRMREGRMERSEWETLLRVLGRLSTAKLKIDDTSNITPEMLLNRARRYKITHGRLDLIVVDYLQLMARHLVDGRKFPTLRMAVQHCSAYMVHISRVLNVPVLELAQLGRDVDAREGHRPMMSDLQESAAIEQDADLILFLLREEKYKQTDQNKGILKIIFGKHRDGSTTHDIDMYFIEKYTRMEPLARD